MVPWLGPRDPLPPPATARRSPNGLLAAGGGLAVPRLLDAYRQGVFPWFSDGEPVLWWCPDPRMVLPTDAMHVSASLARRLKRADYHVTADTAFVDVVRACAAPRGDDGGTWITAEMLEAYSALHRAGHAHSVEVWAGGALAGGIYGVTVGRAFFGESMFSRVTDGSKIALAWLAAQLRRWDVPFIDCQVPSDHLASLGAVALGRNEFLAALTHLVDRPALAAVWRMDPDLTGTVVAAEARPAVRP
ncbi:MAG: leucyl/phenylalanyl-tRNA--protein transferase [Vicinamibacterales bacterium]